MSALVFIHVDLKNSYVLEVNSPNFALDSILSQIGDFHKLHPITFCSRKFEGTKVNYEIHNKELLAIVESFEQCRLF
jgi:hypothetical protein